MVFSSNDLKKYRNHVNRTIDKDVLYGYNEKLLFISSLLRRYYLKKGMSTIDSIVTYTGLPYEIVSRMFQPRGISDCVHIPFYYWLIAFDKIGCIHLTLS